MSKGTYPSHSNGQGRVNLSFELLGGGAAADLSLSTDAAQLVASATYSATGIFIVTMKDAWVSVVDASSGVDDTANDGAYATLGDITNEGTTTPLTFKLRFRSAGGTLADPALARRIGVSLVMKDTQS